MAYLDTRRRPDAGSMAAVVAIHLAIGSALVLGLTVSGIIEKREVLAGFQVDPPKPPPPSPTPTAEQREIRPIDKQIVIPRPPIPIPTATTPFDTADVVYSPLPPVRPGSGDAMETVIPSPTPSFAAIGAKPRNDPLGWVTTEDYRSNWIRQDMAGRVRFRVDIASDGRITSCTITGTSGYPALDAATCTLVSRRAKFQPARGSDGNAVGGSYTNVIEWRLPT